MIVVPDSLAWWRATARGAAWLDRLPALAAERADDWRLTLGPPLSGGNVALVVAAEREDGTSAVLKINFPDAESQHEADALAFWAGDGAVRLLAFDRASNALLLERLAPGMPLWNIADDDEATGIASAVLRRLWRPPQTGHPFRLLADEAQRWAQQLPGVWRLLGAPFERALLDEATGFVAEAARSQVEQVVLHQDFHGGNVLASSARGWVAIDPKPLVGEREFDAASLLRDRRWLLGEARYVQLVRRRLDRLETELGLDRSRLRGWGIVHALAWGVSADAGKVETDMVECARILLRA